MTSQGASLLRALRQHPLGSYIVPTRKARYAIVVPTQKGLVRLMTMPARYFAELKAHGFIDYGERMRMPRYFDHTNRDDPFGYPVTVTAKGQAHVM